MTTETRVYFRSPSLLTPPSRSSLTPARTAGRLRTTVPPLPSALTEGKLQQQELILIFAKVQRIYPLNDIQYC